MWGKYNILDAWQGKGNKEWKNKRTVIIQKTESGKFFYGYDMMLMDITSHMFQIQRFSQKRQLQNDTENKWNSTACPFYHASEHANCHMSFNP